MIDINVANIITILLITIFGIAAVKWGLNAAGVSTSLV